MKKPKFVYHGSGKNMKIINPTQARGLDPSKEDDNLNAVYATSFKEEAMVMGLFGCKGVKSAKTNTFASNKGIKIDAFIVEGWPNQEYFFVYTLSPKNFEERPKKSHQWISFKPVKPLKVEKFLVEDYIHLIKKNER